MMSLKDFRSSISTAKVAGPQQPTTSKRSTDIVKETLNVLSPTPSTSSTMSSVQETSDMKMGKLFAFIDDTYRDIRRLHSGLHKDSFNTHLMQTINKYKNGCNKIFEEVLESHEMSKKLAQNIVRTIDIFKELCACLTDLEEYQHRVCEMMSIFIACELRLSVDATIQEHILIGQRIVYLMRRHLVEEIEEDTRYNILRTLVYIPRLFNARNIMCAIFGQFIPMKPISVVNVLPDKLYMLYIIVFYRWMMMQKDDDDKQLIVNFAESFMKPSVSLCTNQLYAKHLPRYATHSAATRTILNNMKFYRDIRNASIIDNALKKIGSIVDLCEDDEDADLVILNTSNSTEFAEVFSSIKLDSLDDRISHIKLEEETIVGTVNLTVEDEGSTNYSPETIRNRHDKWLNNFQQLAKQFRESQIIMERQKNSHQISNNEKKAIICLDSDSESENEISTATCNTGPTTAASKNNTKSNELAEDLFVDNYPLTVTPINCGTDLEPSDVEDNEDSTKLSPRFLSGSIRTYQAKKVNQLECQTKIDKAYRRDSIHISSTPPDNPDDEYSDNQEDDGTDVQDEHDQDADEVNSFTSITLEKPRPRGPYPTYNETQIDKVVFSQSLTRLPHNIEQCTQGLNKEEHNKPQTKQYYSDSSEIKTPKKQKKRVHFNISPVGPTHVASPVQSKPLKPTLQPSKYKASEAPEYFHLRVFDRFTNTGHSATGSPSTILSINKQQQQKEHIAAAPTLFRNIFSYPDTGPFSPSSSTASSRSLTSPLTSLKSRKKSIKVQKQSIKKRRPTMGAKEDLNKDSEYLNNEDKKEYFNIRSREALNDGYYLSRIRDKEPSDECYGAASDTDTIKSDAKLRKRCTVVIRPTKELLQYERKRDELYNEILQKQRRKLELRALEKQREKERRQLSKREEKNESAALLGEETTEKGLLPTSMDKRNSKQFRREKNYKEIFMSSESEYESNFQIRTRKQKQQNLKELQPLQIQIGTIESTATLLSAIDSHLDKPVKEVHDRIEEPKQQEEHINTGQKLTSIQITENVNQQICDNTNDTDQTKMRELNLLADIAQHLSPYQLDIPPENNDPPQPSLTQQPQPQPPPPPSPPPTSSPLVVESLTTAIENSATQNKYKNDICKDIGPVDKVIITEQLFIQSFDNLIDKSQQIDENEKQENQSHQEQEDDIQQEETPDYAHEPKLNVATAMCNSSPLNLLQKQQTNTLINNNEVIESSNKIRSENIENSLEQILEESIKSVTSPFNPNSECNASRSAQTQNESTIPLLISNVESLNRSQHNSLADSIISNNDDDDDDDDVDKNNKHHLLQNENNQLNNENNFFTNKLTNEAKDVTENNTNINETSTLISAAESSIICADLSNMSNEMKISNNLKVQTLMSADLSDISLESELSKHLPEIAEPSPVVTDMSDNSTESDVSKSCGHHTSTTELVSANISVINLPDLPLEMSSITPQSTALPQTQETSIPLLSSAPSQFENNLNPLDSSLNTPIKHSPLPGVESFTTHSKADLITPIKFALQPEIESDNTSLRSTLEPESDNNVTNFLDLILNKTVTDAESETRDKIIKELNALTTTDTSSVDLAEQEAESVVQDSRTEDNNNPVDTAATLEEYENVNPVQNLTDENISLESNKIYKDHNASEGICRTDKLKDDIAEVLDNSERNHKESNIEDYCDTSTEESLKTSSFVEPTNTESEQSNTKTTLVLQNTENFPPKDKAIKETSTVVNTELTSTKLICETAYAKIKTSPAKQTYNIKCRVRLKRLNIVEHCKSTKKVTWVAIPITKPEEPDSVLKDLSICDNNSKTDTMQSLIKKPCLKYNNKRADDDLSRKFSEGFIETMETTAAKKPKLDEEEQNLVENVETSQNQQQQQQQKQETTGILTSNTSASGVHLNNNNNNSSPMKSKSKNPKTVTFDLSNLNEEVKDNVCNHKPQKVKGHTGTPMTSGLGCYQKSNRQPRKLSDNTLRAAETLQIFVNTINDCAHAPPVAEFNRKRSPIKNKCIAEDETPRPPAASTLMNSQTCKKICTEKSRSQITSSKCKDQLVSNIANDISTARIYTSSPLDQTLPEYNVDNVDTVADSELILPATTGSLRRKLKRRKKSLLTRPEHADGITTDDIINQPECNGDDDTDAVVDNEDDVFVEELLPIPAADEHILEEIVSATPPHIGTGTVIRDEYMNIEATATVPANLFNDESRDLATPEPNQSSDTNMVDSSSYLNAQHLSANVPANTTATTSVIGNLEKSMLSPSEHEVSSTQETFYQTPTKNKQTDEFGEKYMAIKDKSSSCSSNVINNKIKAGDKGFQNKDDDQTSSTTGLLQNNQVDTTNHSPEMCTLTLTGPSSTNTTSITSNRKIRKASTHDEILFNEMQQQKSLQQNKRKTIFCAESTSDSSNIFKNKTVPSKLDDIKTNGSLGKFEDKFKKLLKEGVNKTDKNDITNNGLCVGNIKVSGGGSSPSTTTIINEEKPLKSKRKKLKSSKSEKLKQHEKPPKIVLKASKLTPHAAPNPLIITIPKSRLIRPPPTPSPPTTPNGDLKESAIAANYLNKNDNKIAKDKEKSYTIVENKSSHSHSHNASNAESIDNAFKCKNKSKHSYNSDNLMSELIDTKTIVLDSEKGQLVLNASTSIAAAKDKEKTSYLNSLNSKKKTKANISTDNSPTTNNSTSASSSLTSTTTATNCSNKNNNSHLIFVKDKYDLIKSKDKQHHQLQENKEKSKNKINIEIKKHGNRNKLSTNSGTANNSTNRHHKISTKEKTREKHNRDKPKTYDNTLTASSNVLKSIAAGSNLSLSSSTFMPSPSAILTTASSHAKQSSSGKINKNKMQDLINSSTSTTITTKVNLAASQLSSPTLSSPTGLTTQTNSIISTTTSTSTLPTSPMSLTISTNHVRKKIKTK